MANKRKGSTSAKKREAMSIYGTRVEGNYPVWGSFGIGMDGPAKLIIEGRANPGYGGKLEKVTRERGRDGD